MANLTKTSETNNSIGFTLLYSAIVILTAQISVHLFTDHFVVSAGVIFFALLMLLLDRFAAMPVVFISATGVMITRSFVAAGAVVGPDEIWRIGMPEFVFYIVYGVLIYLLYNYLYKGRQNWMIFIVLVIPDFAANIFELYIRIGSEIGNSKTILVLLLIACIRSAIVLAVYKLLIHNGVRIVSMPRSGIEVVDGKAQRVEVVQQDNSILEYAAIDAYVLCKKLESANVSEDILNKAKSLVEDIERVSKG